MPALLSKTSLPTWVLIVIVAVGSICILTTAALIIRCTAIRRRAKRNSSVIEQGPMRKMTVRRGRMVPASKYLSLTGSRFGLNQFDEADTKSGRKSPMQWWNNVKERKQGDRFDTERGDIYNRRSFVQSTSSLTDEKHGCTTIQEVEPAFPSPTGLPSPAFPSPAAQRSPDRNSYSRPFQPRASTFMHARNLSMIEEASPHNSVVSSRSNPRKSGMSLTPTIDQFPHYDQRRLSPGPSSPSFPLRSSPNQSNSDLPRHLAYAGSRTNVSENIAPQRSSLSNSQGSSRHDSVTEISISRPVAQDPSPYPSSQPSTFDSILQSQAQSQPQPQPQPQPRQQANDYQQRIHRIASTKGTVLRKKSLRQHQVCSAVAT